jgi:hemin uptake protein HemP
MSRTEVPSLLAPRPTVADVPVDRCVASSLLLGDSDRLWIAHDGELYCLRLTRRNRLILTK